MAYFIQLACRKKWKKETVFMIIIVAFFFCLNFIRKYFTKEEEIITFEPNTKYILLWTSRIYERMKNLGHGKESFINRKCPNVNCYVSFDRMLLGDAARFDVIIFHSVDINVEDLPTSRSPYQKYVLVSMESSENYPMCNKMFDGFFNWTWTYKLSSDVLYPYFIIKDSNGNIIGPKQNMHWKRIEEMEPINEDLKRKLSKKSKAAAWFIPDCHTRSERETLVNDLQLEMLKYDLRLDVKERCSLKCLRSDMRACLQMLQEDYYFYLSFENSISEDYVTEKLFHALRNYVVPIVFGGANYTRFIPDGTYLDAKTVTPAELAAKMMEVISDKEQYYSYFRWHNHYSYHEPTNSSETDPYCNLCSTVNQKSQEKSEYKDFLNWWTTPENCMYHNFNSYLALIYMLINAVNH